MNSFILYLLEASLVLVVLYAAYRLLLSRETFFGFNRFFLLAILVLSLLLPLVSFEVTNSEKNFIKQQSTELGKARNSYHMSFENWSRQAPSESQTSWWQQFWYGDWDPQRIVMVLAIAIYCIGFMYRLFRLSLGYVKIYFLKKKLVSTDLDGLKVMRIPATMAPFSFLNTVFIPDNIEDETEYRQIMAHENTHIQQQHSIDLIFVQLVAAFLWFNPVVWLLLKSLKQTHEYIADKNMIRQGFSLVEYQSLLLRQLISNNSYGLVHNFNLSFIKKRIAMMSIKESGWTGKSKAVIALFLIVLMGMMTAQSNTMLGGPVLETGEAPKAADLEMKFYIDGVLLNEGLSFSQIRRYKGEFKFALDNSKEDNIHIGLDLVRKGQVVGHASQRLEENASFEIRELLSKARQEDYLVIDIMEGPSEAVKLYNFPLFRESKGWKKNQGQAGDLPPPPVDLFLDGVSVSPQKAVSFSELKARGLKAELAYVLSEFVDFQMISRQGGDVKSTLLRNGEAVKSITSEGVKRKATISLNDLLEVAKKGDTVMVQFGDPNGLRFGSLFLLE